MDEKKMNRLSEDELAKVSGGMDDYDLCEWGPDGNHEGEMRR